MHPVSGEAEAVDGRIFGTEAEAARLALLHVERHRQAAVRLDLFGFLEAHGAEDFHATETLFGFLDIVGIVFLAFFQPRHPGDELRVHARRSDNADRPVMRLLARIERNIGGNPVVGVIGHDVLIGNARLGVALLAPCLDGETLGPDDRARTRHLSRCKTGFFGRLHVIALVDRRRRYVGDRGAREQELRAGIDGDRDLRIVWNIRIGRNFVRLAAIDKDGNGAAIAALAIERGQDAAIVAARLGEQSGGTRSGPLRIRLR